MRFHLQCIYFAELFPGATNDAKPCAPVNRPGRSRLLLSKNFAAWQFGGAMRLGRLGNLTHPMNRSMNNLESDEDSDSAAKVAAIFRELVGDRAARLDGSHYNRDSAATIARALSPCPDDRNSPEDIRTRDIAFHLTDWASNAAFIVATQLFPDRFTAAEIADGVESFLIHAPNHVAAAAALSGHPIEDIFEVGALKGPGIDD